MLTFCLVTVMCMQIFGTLGQVSPPYGDVTTTCNGANITPIGGSGVVMFYNGQEYLPICLEGFTRGAAAAVCHQLGFIDANNAFPPDQQKYFGHPIALGCEPENQQQSISSAKCPDVSNYTTNGELHIARCFIGEQTNNSCTAVAIRCNPTRIYEDSSYRYNGLVYLKNIHPGYSGIATMYFQGQDYQLCNISTIAADSLCRQLGYTGALNVLREQNPLENSINIKKSLCTTQTGPYSCFSHCFDPASYEVTSCRATHITCDFQAEDILIKSAGNQFSCAINPPDSSSGATTAFAILFSFAVIVIILYTVFLYFGYKYMKKKIEN